MLALSKIGMINDMFILYDYRRRGVGKLLYDELKKWFAFKQLEYIELTVHVHNKIGQEAWAKYGFSTALLKQQIKI
jgi:ribosomal protein S18 acetylase RimI-like enzyme